MKFATRGHATVALIRSAKRRGAFGASDWPTERISAWPRVPRGSDRSQGRALKSQLNLPFADSAAFRLEWLPLDKPSSILSPLSRPCG